MSQLATTIFREAIPSMKAMVAKRLVEVYGLSQKQAAAKMGTTQPAISQYKRGIRGNKTAYLLANQKAVETLESLAKRVANNELTERQVMIELLRICEALLSDDSSESVV